MGPPWPPRLPGARVLRTGENGGPATARNRAIAEATGEWLAVLDSDDAMEPGRLRRMIDLGHEVKADVVLGNFRTVDEAGKAIGPAAFLEGRGFDMPRVWTLEDFVAGNQVTRGSRPFGYLKPVFRRAFLQETGLRYDPGLRNGEDCHMIFACLAAGATVVFAPWPDYIYSSRRGSISHRVDPAHMDALIEADAAFVARHGAQMTPRTRTLFDFRRTALACLRDSEIVLMALKAARPGRALAVLVRRPSVAGRVMAQLGEAVGNRIRRLR